MRSDSKRPHIIGLTGSIGMGKSTVAQMLVDEGVALFDADAEVHRLQGSRGDLVAEIEAAFPGTTGPGGVDRKVLGAMVLSDRDRLAQLEMIIHPAVARSRMAFVEEHRTDDMIVFDIPLLFEKRAEGGVDSIVVVSAPADQQRERVLARPGMSEERFESILALQLDDAEKRKGADYVIENGSSLAETRGQVEKLVETLRAALVSRAK
ncbi:MAG: dephospho-CoA kinase [Sphingorhabdus sp.]